MESAASLGGADEVKDSPVPALAPDRLIEALIKLCKCGLTCGQ